MNTKIKFIKLLKKELQNNTSLGGTITINYHGIHELVRNNNKLNLNDHDVDTLLDELTFEGILLRDITLTSDAKSNDFFYSLTFKADDYIKSYYFKILGIIGTIIIGIATVLGSYSFFSQFF